jgi:hypothetical protein
MLVALDKETTATPSGDAIEAHMAGRRLSFLSVSRAVAISPAAASTLAASRRRGA